MSKKLLVGLGIAAFLAVEFFGVQTSDAQRLRNFLRRNNNNNCQNCGVSTESTGTVVGESYVTPGAEYGTPIEPAIESYGGQVVSEYPTVSEFPTEYSAPMGTEIPTVAATEFPVATEYPTVDFTTEQMPVESYPMEQPVVMSQPMIESSYPIESMPTDSFVASPASYEVAPQGCIGCGGNMGVPVETTSFEGQIIDGGSYVGEGSVIQSDYVESTPQVMGCASGDCGGAIVGGSSIQDGAVFDSQASYSEGTVEGAIEGAVVGSSAEQIISSEIITETPITAEADTTPTETAVESPAEETTTKDAAPETKDAVPDAPPKEAPNSEDGKEA